MLQKFRLSTRILLLGIGIIVSFALTFTWIIPKVKNNMYEAKFNQTKHVVEAAWGVLNYYGKQSSMPVEEAKKMAKETIKALRYDNQEYFWINDLEPRMIMHPIKPEMDGTNLSENKDPNGKRLFVTMAEVSRKEGAGFVDYLWPKPSFSKPVPKISYVKLFPEWGWIVGSGIYLDDVEKEISQLMYIILGAVILITLGGLLLSFWMARSITRPINTIVEGLNDGAGQVASASAQVSSASQSLAEGASEQAAGLEETSSSIEEMTSMTRQNADNAGQANTLMRDTGNVMDEANQAMKDLTQSMHEISVASEETGKIIKTIDEIAFQTNLLALNAAVEAARAGEAGAGFAVVADEVRNLAMRAAEAAKNTSNLIEGTVKKIKAGSDIVGRTNQAFEKVAGGSRKVAELVGEIAAASQEQAQGIDQINKAVSEMDRVVQQNAASAEESASASEEMNAQAEQMKDFVAELKNLINGNGQGNGFHRTKALPVPEGNGKRMAAMGYQLKSKFHKALPKPVHKGNGKQPGTYRPVLSKFREVSPEQMIPMEEGEFKAF
jgi:methyl-accepting chemotaxis protein